jgi:hypothetical protein
MGRGAYNFCPRASIPPLPELDPIEPVSMQDPIITPNKPADEAMTWQQEKAFGHLVVSEPESSLPSTPVPPRPRTASESLNIRYPLLPQGSKLPPSTTLPCSLNGIYLIIELPR